MSPKPVGESRADDRPWRRGPLVDAIRDRASSLSLSPGSLVPRQLRMFPFTAPTTPTTVEPLDKRSDLEADYDTDWARGPGARVARAAIQRGALLPSLELIAPRTVQGRDRIDHLDGPLIFAPNHHSHVDIAVVLASLPNRIRRKTIVAAAGDYFFDTKAKAGLSALALNAVPIERQKVSRRSTDQVAALLARGWNLVIFPEGGRSPDGLGQTFKPGSTYLAIKQRCPIVPVHIDGTDHVLPKGSSLPRRHHVTVTFGEAIVPTGDDDARRLTERLERAVDALAEESRTDWWTARRNAAAGASASLRGPSDAASWRRQWSKTTTKPTPTREANASPARSDGPSGKRSWP